MAGERLRDVLGRRPDVLVPVALAAFASALVFVVATTVFPYHSANHDEGVYLQQAAMLLEGQLRLYPGPLADVFRPWFFVQEGGTLYPKYAPVPAAMFALGRALFGEFRVALALIAAGNAALVYAIATEGFDRRTGALAALALIGSPLFLISSSVFLPYAPTMLLNLTFCLAYVRALRRESRRYAVLAGVAIGLAFFSRPYTAVLFATPFVAHAGWTTLGALRTGRWVGPLAARYALVAGGGLAFVGVTLAYNAALTGSPLVFPYERFAPLDGLGFGRRDILGHTVQYTPELAVYANRHVLQYFFTRWMVAGPLGTVCAVVGVARFLADARGQKAPLGAEVLPDVELRALLCGLLVTIPLGNVYFWGNLNILANVEDPTTGLVALFGPFYHFDMLLPISVFAASGVVVLWTGVASLVRENLSARRARVALAVLLVASVPTAAVAERAVVEPPLEGNAAHTETYEQAYTPFEERTFENALVFVPTPYGDWQNHPFQYLRNDPGFDGAIVYALDRGPARDFAVIDAYPGRTIYRYSYRGEWTPGSAAELIPKLERLEARNGPLEAETTVGVPANVTGAWVRISNGEEVVQRDIPQDELGEQLSARWTLSAAGARLEGEDGGVVPIRDADDIAVTVTLAQADGGTLTYRQEVDVRRTGDAVEVIWPPQTSVCRLVADCGLEGTYVPDEPGVHPEAVWLETELRAENESESAMHYRKRSARQTVTMDLAMAAPPTKGSSLVSPRRSW